ARPAPLAQQFAGRVVDRDPVRLPFLPFPLGEMSEVQLARAADGDPARIGEHGDDRQELALYRKLLHARVVKVRNENLVGGVDGNADREMKLARLRTQLAPLAEETRRGAHSPGDPCVPERTHGYAAQSYQCDRQ